MSNTRVCFLRHGTALHNEKYDELKAKGQLDTAHTILCNEIYQDSPLTKAGMETILAAREKLVNRILEEVKTVEAILVSPLKRALQTLLLTLPTLVEKTKVIPPIFVLGCLTEIEVGDEQKLPHIPLCSQASESIHLDSDLRASPWYRYINFHQYFLKDKESWHQSRDNAKKLMAFKKTLLEFTGAVLVVGHRNYIRELTGEGLDRYQCTITSVDRLK